MVAAANILVGAVNQFIISYADVRAYRRYVDYDVGIVADVERVYHVRQRIVDSPDVVRAEVETAQIAQTASDARRPFAHTAVALFVALVATVVYRAKIRGIQKRQRIYRETIVQLMHTFARTIDARDSLADGHSLRVARYARELAKRMGQSTEEQENIYCVALLHDIGEIGTADDCVTRADETAGDEHTLLSEHPVIGEEVLKDFPALRGIADGAKYHHVRYDGLGHREQPSGTEIPLVARIIAVADAYDAMSHGDSESQGLAPDVIAQKLRKGSGTKFDPEIVPHMVAMIEEGVVPASSEN